MGPFIKPAQALYTPDLVPIRRLEEVQPGSFYLIKGQEQLDPPPSFLDMCIPIPPLHGSGGGSAGSPNRGKSFKAMRAARDAQAALRDTLPRTAASPIGSLMNARHTSTMSRITSVNYAYTPPSGSPPWMSYGVTATTPQKSAVWRPNPRCPCSTRVWRCNTLEACRSYRPQRASRAWA